MYSIHSFVVRAIACWFCVGLAASALCGASDGMPSIDLSVSLDRPEVVAGGRGRVELSLTWSGAPDAFAVLEWSAPESGGAPLAIEMDQTQTGVDKGRPVYRRRVVYTVRADVPGEVAIGPARIRLKGPDGKSTTYATNPLKLTVLPEPAHMPWVEIGLSIAAVVLVVVALRAGRKSRPAPVKPSMRQMAAFRVEALRPIGARNHREFFEACLTALKDGLAQDHGLPLKDRDRGRITKAMTDAGLAPCAIRAAEELYTLCDEARFNPEPPPESARNRALTLLETVLSD